VINHGFNAVLQNGSAASELSLPMRITASWFGPQAPTEYKDVARTVRVRHAGLPSYRHPDMTKCAGVLGAVQGQAFGGR
jgi:hypothetical protein